MPRTKKRRIKPESLGLSPKPDLPWTPQNRLSTAEINELASQPRWVNHVNRGLNKPPGLYHRSPEREKVAIKLADVKGTCKIDKEHLMARSGFFQAMLDGRFKESSTGEVTLHDDHIAGIATVLRYIVGIDDFVLHDSHTPRPQDLRLSVHQWRDLGSDLTSLHMPATRSHLLLLIVLTAEKYMVPDLSKMAVKEMAFICGVHSFLGDDGHVFVGNQKIFLQDHYFRAKSMWEGEYPPILYEVFKSVLKKLWQQDAPSNKMEAVAKQDERLKAYLLADGSFRMRIVLDWKVVLSELLKDYDVTNDISSRFKPRG